MTSIPFESLVGDLRGRGVTVGEIYSQSRRSLTIRLESGTVRDMTSFIDQGVGIRRVVGDGQDFAALSRPGISDIRRAMAGIKKSAGRKKPIFLRSLTPPWRQRVDCSPHRRHVKDKIELIREADRLVRDYDPRVKQVLILYRETVDAVTIATIEGELARDRRNDIVFLVQVVAEDNGLIQTSREVRAVSGGIEKFSHKKVVSAARKAAERVVTLLKADPAPQGTFPVVISSRAGGTMVHEAIGHGLEADLARRGLSVYSNRLGEPVATGEISILDDPTLPGRRGSYRFDDEGVPAQKTVLVEKGILKTFLYDRLSAHRDKLFSNGHGRRESYRHPPIPRMGNTIIAPGKKNPRDLISAVDHGILVIQMGGGQVDTVSGDFVFEVAEGYLIRAGKQGPPIRNATLVGNGPKTLEEVRGVGNDLGFGVGTCGKDGQGVPVADAQPTLLIDRMVIGGTTHSP